MGKLSAALNAIFSTSGDAGLTSSMKVPYFKSKTIDGNTAFYPDGMASMSALASVLGGVIQRGNVSSSSDGSDCVETGFYTVANNSNFPGSNYGTLIVFTDAAASHAAIVQEYITNGAGIYMRRRSGTNDAWNAWSRIDNFGCNTAADLASLLGGDDLITGYLKRRGPVPNFDFNQAIDYGLYYITNENNWVNGPTGITKDQALLLSYGWNVNSRSIQVLFVTGVGTQTFEKNGVYMRVYRSGMNPNWTDWVKS